MENSTPLLSNDKIIASVIVRACVSGTCNNLWKHSVVHSALVKYLLHIESSLLVLRSVTSPPNKASRVEEGSSDGSFHRATFLLLLAYTYIEVAADLCAVTHCVCYHQKTTLIQILTHDRSIILS